MAPNPQKQQFYPIVDTAYVVEKLYQDMLLTFYGNNPSMDQKIKQAWERKYGVPFREADTEYVNPTILHGSPGHGKTTSYKVAAKMVANDLGLNFVINPDESYVPSENDLLFVSYELSGQVSSADFGGLPSKAKVAGADYMSKLPNFRLAILQKTGASVLLLDDLANAAPAIQNIALSVAEERRFQGLNLGNTFVGCTSNLGAQDRTHVSAFSAALESRCRNFQVRDTLPNFVTRVQSTFKDDIGDAGLLGFLKKNEESFSVETPPQRGPFPCPRTWMKLLSDLRRHVAINMPNYKTNRVASLASSMDLQIMASSLVGMDAAQKVSSYFHMLYTGAAPLAAELMEKGELSEDSKKRLEEKMGSGHSAEGHEFGHQWAVALADECATRVAKVSDNDEKVHDIYRRYAAGISMIEPTHIMFSISHFMGKMENMGVFTDDKNRMAYEHKEAMVRTLQENSNITRYDLEVIIESLSNYAVFRQDLDFSM